MFVPLTHPSKRPSRATHQELILAEALAVIGGVERKIHFLAMSLP